MKSACMLYLSYLTLDTTSYQSQEPNDKLVRMTQPSAKLIAHVALYVLTCPSVRPTPFPAFLVLSEPHPSVLSLPTSASASV